VTSSGQNDSGLFEVNLKDERYLPFEGAGAISTWQIELPNDVPQFDFESISDVVLHVRYTARAAGNLRAPASTHVHQDVLDDSTNLLQLFCLNYDFGETWQSFTSAATDADRRLDLRLTTDQFPYWLQRVGMDDALVATFAVIDWKKNRLSLGPVTVAATGDVADGWKITVDQNAPIFPFLRRYEASKLYMAVSYAAT